MSGDLLDLVRLYGDLRYEEGDSPVFGLDTVGRRRAETFLAITEALTHLTSGAPRIVADTGTRVSAVGVRESGTGVHDVTVHLTGPDGQQLVMLVLAPTVLAALAECLDDVTAGMHAAAVAS